MIEVHRKEIKYQVSRLEFARVKPMLAACMELDGHSAGGYYNVSSLYFDSAFDDDLAHVLDGLANKQKVRLRAYSADAGSFKLEYKCKTCSDGRKSSLDVTREQAVALARKEWNVLSSIEGPLASELYGRLRMGVYQPRVVVKYKRIPFRQNLSNIRITYDYDLSASFDPQALFDHRAAFEPVGAPDMGVLEIKYDGFLPSYLKDIAEKINAMPVANSKYVQARLLL